MPSDSTRTLRYRLYDFPESGNTYKIKLALRQLDIPFETVSVDILKGETHLADFAMKNPLEMVPVLERLSDGVLLAESNAILWYLTQGTDLMPEGVEAQTEALKWMFFEQNVLEPNIGRARRLLHSEGLTPDEAGLELQQRQQAARDGLRVLDRAMGERLFLVRDKYSLSDIAVFGYVHVAPEGGISLSTCPNVTCWIERVRNTPGFLGLGDFIDNAAVQ